MKTIYLDVLIVLNIYVNFFLLKATAKFIHAPLKSGRCILSSVIGSLFSLSILLPSGSFLLSLIIKFTASAIITAMAFGIRNKGRYIRFLIYFYIINFIFAGIVIMLYIVFKPSFMAVNNTYIYVDFSLISLVVFTAAAYFAVTAVRHIMDRSADTERRYSISIRYKGRYAKVDALADTGNSLTDGFTGKSVVICSKEALGFDEDISVANAEMLYRKYSFRMIPYSTIGGTGMIPVFAPDELLITDDESGNITVSDALVGLVSRETAAIFNPNLI